MPGSAKKDSPTVGRSHALLRSYPDGVVVHEVRNIVTRNGLTTEVYRSDWGTSETLPQQALFVTLRAGAISAWHMHQRQVDQIFVVAGALKLVLFDPREGSATRGQVFELFLERTRPSLVSLPPGIWHGLTPMGAADASFINFFNNLYAHDDPDEWRLPLDTSEIPYRF